jgi:hypothetical protein
VTELHTCLVTENHTFSVTELHTYSVTELHTPDAVRQETLQEILGPINYTLGDKGDAFYQLQRLLGVTKTKALFNPTKHWLPRVPHALALNRTGSKIRTNNIEARCCRVKSISVT